MKTNEDFYLELMDKQAAIAERQAKAAELANLIAIASSPIIFNRYNEEQQEHILAEIDKRNVEVIGMTVKPMDMDVQARLNSLGL